MSTGTIEYINLEELTNSNYVINDGQANIIGWPVRSEDGTDIGIVRDLLIDPAQNAVRYLIIDLSKSLVIDEDKAVLIPIGYISLADDEKKVIIPVTHESQLMALPQYIIGEVTRDVESQIRTALGSPAASRIEGTVIEEQDLSFYQHHHFDRGNIIGTSANQIADSGNVKSIDQRHNEEAKIHDLVAESKVRNEVYHKQGSQQLENNLGFTVHTDHGLLRVEPLDNGTYRIFDRDEKIGVVYAQTAAENGLAWGTMDDLPESLVNQIGEAITTHNEQHSKF
ncbi:PRC-barrel domain-containing protein [Pedobacter aquatilis]|uniref:PRC-barrel domain-containing protein n=1 Tax=Pedobacter aquatilis TaxID=351343 RepID=UPI0025B46B31|nr:PRC-barrel domain-containing protein [Pedobacter aquatilis]MDN3588462.1 PRC-barrel domain-containing protein [Pedobacter aquatilis]